jgi:hypothetical protein
MRKVIFTAALLSTVASIAIAQEAPYSQTLDEQAARVRSGQPAVPMANPPSSVPDKMARKPISTEWPATSGGTVSSSGYSETPVTPVARDGEIIQSQGSDAIPALPLTVFTSRSVKYVTGGVGDEELAQLKSIENDFNMRLLIARTEGNYIGDATVRILDSSGAEVIAIGDAGPYVYASLMPGTYTVEVTTADGMSKRVTTKVPQAPGSKAVVRF